MSSSIEGTVLVTGGAGMIGSNLVRRLRSLGLRVKVVDNLWRGKLDYLNDASGEPVIDLDEDFYELDLSNPDVLDPILPDVDIVVHLADIVAGIGYVFNNQGSIFRQNLLINSNVVTSLRKTRVKGYLYVGTVCSFPRQLQSGVGAAPLKEEDQYPANPESAYGWSKLMGEYEAMLFEKETATPVCVLALHNVYGTPTDYTEGRSQVIPSLVRKAVEAPEKDFVVWGSGDQGRAFVHVDDVVDAIILGLEKGMGQGATQIGPDVCTSIREIAETVVSISNKQISIEYDTSKPEGDRGRRADYSKAKRVLGWEPRVPLRDGLADLYRWIEQRMQQDERSGTR
jgi:GDP-D-mannose 3', 5'-epimerase